MEEILRSMMALCKNFTFMGIEHINIYKATEEDFNFHDPQKELEKLAKFLDGCTRCRLSQTRTNLVFGHGNPRAKLVFVGEGPGYEEDMQGLPFVGQAGRLLTKMIKSIGLERKDVYICNVVKCRPPKNRTPLKDEVLACSPFLIKQLEIIKPAVICALGSCATETLIGSKLPISKLRGQTFKWKGITVIPTFHPAYLLRNPLEKRKAWEDLVAILKIISTEGA